MRRADCPEWSEPHLLSFVAHGEYLAIHADLPGITMFIDTLEWLREELEKNDCPHTHLLSLPGVANRELTDSNLDSEAGMTSVVEVRIYGWNEEWAVKQGLKPHTESDHLGEEQPGEDAP